MTTATTTDPALQLAIAWQPSATRPALEMLFRLDAMLAGVVAKAREPMLAQIRFAWWRERLAEPAELRPRGNPLLGEIACAWQEQASSLTFLIDAWEELLAGPPFHVETVARHAELRGAGFAAFAQLARASGSEDAAATAGRRWALADLASRPGLAVKEVALIKARALPATKWLPRSLRGVAVLDGLAVRAVTDGRPLMTKRGDALAAWRLGLLGR